MTHASQHFKCNVDESDIEHGFGQLNMSKMTWTALIIAVTSETWKRRTICAQATIRNALRLWLPVFVRLLVLDLRNGYSTNLIWTEYTKLYMIQFSQRST